jgi:hypothetical protein
VKEVDRPINTGDLKNKTIVLPIFSCGYDLDNQTPNGRT